MQPEEDIIRDGPVGHLGRRQSLRPSVIEWSGLRLL